MNFKAQASDALIVIDMQRDFLPGGALAVPDGDGAIPAIRALADHFRTIVLTQDWHPPGHVSFASRHGRAPFGSIDLETGPQTLWPDHCVQGSSGAELTPALGLERAQLVLRKGCNPGLDSYSAFCEADRRTKTGLEGWLRERGVTRVVCVGLATDFCVSWSAQDAAAAGFDTFVATAACRAIDLAGSLDRAMQDMAAAGVRFLES